MCTSGQHNIAKACLAFMSFEPKIMNSDVTNDFDQSDTRIDL